MKNYVYALTDKNGVLLTFGMLGADSPMDAVIRARLKTDELSTVYLTEAVGDRQAYSCWWGDEARDYTTRPLPPAREHEETLRLKALFGE